MQKIQIAHNKTLKLTNACICDIIDSDIQEMEQTIYKMENYIKAKGALPLGPIIQCATVEINEAGEATVKLQLIRQTNTFITKLESPYTMVPILRCKDCIFARFIGEAHELKYAYDKLNLIAYEDEINLTGRSYTVFTAQNDDQFSADIFMEKVSAN